MVYYSGTCTGNLDVFLALEPTPSLKHDHISKENQCSINRLLFADEQNKKQEEEQLQVEGEEDQDSDIFWL